VQQRLLKRLNAARGQGGFTLIELLIVIVILGVLAGIVVFSVQFVTNRGNKAACDTDTKNVQTAVEAYQAQNGVYPSDAGALTPSYLKGLPAPEHTITINGNNGVVTGSC
jgi:general secretion pathway protein G